MSEEQMQTEQINEKLIETEQGQTEVTNKGESVDKKFTHKGIMVAVIAFVLTAIIFALVGAGIYNTPANRKGRHLEMATAYLEEQDYKQALEEFNQVIAIDPMSVDAYLGKVQAYEGMGDIANVTKTLQAGYEQNGDGQIKERLVGAWLDQAVGYVESEDYENALLICDRLLELDEENEQIRTTVGDCLMKYIERMLDEERYDEVKMLTEKYQDKASDVDFQAYLNEIDEIERIEVKNTTFLKKVYELMAAEDYEAMREVDGSDEANAFVGRMEGDSSVYLPEGKEDMTGVGAGVYQYGNGGYYFYYGDYVRGKRVGLGNTFIKEAEDCYQVFSGIWEKDAPNGKGIQMKFMNNIVVNEEDHSQVVEQKSYSVKSGNFVDGLLDGSVDFKAYYNGEVFDLSFTAVNGIAQEDKTEEYRRSQGDVELAEGDKIIAFDEKGNMCVWQSSNVNSRWGAIGYEDLYASD